MEGGSHSHDSGSYNHVEGFGNIIQNNYTHVEGINCLGGQGSHVEGNSCRSQVLYGHAQGLDSWVNGGADYGDVMGAFASANFRAEACQAAFKFSGLAIRGDAVLRNLVVGKTGIGTVKLNTNGDGAFQKLTMASVVNQDDVWSVRLHLTGIDKIAKIVNEIAINIAGTQTYVDAVYTDVVLSGGSGTGAKATVTVVGNVITTVVVTSRGHGYLAGDILTVTSAAVATPGAVTILVAGTSRTYTVTSIAPSVISYTCMYLFAMKFPEVPVLVGTQVLSLIGTIPGFTDLTVASNTPQPEVQFQYSSTSLSNVQWLAKLEIMDTNF